MLLFLLSFAVEFRCRFSFKNIATFLLAMTDIFRIRHAGIPEIYLMISMQSLLSSSFLKFSLQVSKFSIISSNTITVCTSTLSAQMAVFRFASAFAVALISTFSILTFIVFWLFNSAMKILQGVMKSLLSLFLFFVVTFDSAYCFLSELAERWLITW